MYNVSKLSNDSKNFIQNLPLISKNNQEVLAYAVSKAVANELSLPSSQIENPSTFYLESLYANVRQIISDINEITVIDLSRIQELVKTLWLVRYNIAYPRKKIFVTNLLVTESHFFGYGSLLSTNEITFIQQNTQLLITICNGFSQIITEMNSGDEIDSQASQANVRV